MSSVIILHSLMRWLVLLTGLAAAGRAIAGWNRQTWTAADNRAGVLFVSALDIQLLLGLLLYLLGPTVQIAFSNIGAAMRMSELRFFLVEHPFGMLIAIVLAHVGRIKTKKASGAAKQRAAAVFYGLALILILLSIPWPGMPGNRPLWPW